MTDFPDLTEEQVRFATVVAQGPTDFSIGYAAMCLRLDKALKDVRVELKEAQEEVLSEHQAAVDMYGKKEDVRDQLEEERRFLEAALKDVEHYKKERGVLRQALAESADLTHYFPPTHIFVEGSKAEALQKEAERVYLLQRKVYYETET